MPQIKTVIVLTLENRSLDNLLGFLYDPGSTIKPYPTGSSTRYDGVPSGAENVWYPVSSVTNRVSSLAGAISSKLGSAVSSLGSYGPARHYSPTNGTSNWNGADPLEQPNWDPNEEFEHVTYQLYADGKGTMPSGDFWSTTPPMTGFAWDYCSAVDDNQSVMGSYNAQQLPAMHGLARNYAVSDRWFASVPTQTFANRAYQLLGTSLGAVDNSEIVGNHVPGIGMSLDSRCTLYKNTPSLFNVLGAAGKSWGVYWQSYGGPAAGSPPGVPFTQWLCPTLDNAPNGGVYPMSKFMNDLAAGTLPNFCFLEPLWGGGILAGTFTTVQGTDYHPPASVAPAEYQLNQLYNAILASPQWGEILFVITFDEHGGTYDHVPPPVAVAPDGVVGSSGFAFQRLGVRVPTILVSPYVQAGTVFRSPVSGSDFDHTSLIATMLKWAGVDPKAADMGTRVANAPTFEGVIGSQARSDKPTFNVPESYNMATGGTLGVMGGTGAAVGVSGGAFTGKCGQNSSATSQAGLALNSQMNINGSTDLSGCVQANNGGCVYGVTVTGSSNPIYDYVINVDAQGPSGLFSGSMYLAFTDQTGDTYKLSVWSSSRSTHTVNYNSAKPLIVKFQWSNTSI